MFMATLPQSHAHTGGGGLSAPAIKEPAGRWGRPVSVVAFVSSPEPRERHANAYDCNIYRSLADVNRRSRTARLWVYAAIRVRGTIGAALLSFILGSRCSCPKFPRPSQA